jgi:hypothetical protein
LPHLLWISFLEGGKHLVPLLRSKAGYKKKIGKGGNPWSPSKSDFGSVLKFTHSYMPESFHVNFGCWKGASTLSLGIIGSQQKYLLGFNFWVWEWCDVYLLALQTGTELETWNLEHSWLHRPFLVVIKSANTSQWLRTIDPKQTRTRAKYY